MTREPWSHADASRISLSQSLSFPHHLLSTSLSPSRATRREPCNRRKPLACGATPTYDPCASRDARPLRVPFLHPESPIAARALTAARHLSGPRRSGAILIRSKASR